MNTSKYVKVHNHIIDLKLVIQRTIATKTGLSYSLVNMTIHGERNNKRTNEIVINAIKTYFPSAIINNLKEAA